MRGYLSGRDLGAGRRRGSEVLLPSTIRLPALHRVLQAAMGWTDSRRAEELRLRPLAEMSAV